MSKKLPKLLIVCLMVVALKANCQWNVVCNSGNGFVDNFEIFNNDLYATGFFNRICGASCNYVAKFDGTNWQAVGNGFPNAGHHLAVIDSVLYGAAYQPNIDSNWFYKFDVANFNKMGDGVYLTTAVVGFSQLPNLYNMIKYNGNIVVSGEFDRVGSKHISGIMQWNGTEWDSLGAGISGHNPLSSYPDPIMYPHDLCLYGTDLIVCGEFAYAGGQPAYSIARWDGSQWYAMGQGFNGAAYGVEVYNGELYAGGDFTLSGTTPLRYIAKWNGTNWIDPGFNLFYSDTNNYSFIHTLKVLNGKLVISGGFDHAVVGTDTMQCTSVAAYNGVIIDTLSGGLPGNEIEGLIIYNGLLFAGGGPLNDSTYIANYNLPASIPTVISSNIVIDIFPNPFTTQTTLTLQGSNHNPSLFIYNLLGQEVRSIPVGTNSQVTINREHLSSGMYFYKVIDENKEVLGIGKLVIE